MPIKKTSSSELQETKTKKSTAPSLQTNLPLNPSSPAKMGCCKGTASCETPHTHASELPLSAKLDPAKKTKTKIVVRYDVGFHNFLSVRGKGANLSWERGIPLKNIKADEWVWETDAAFTSGEFKILLNDHHYEIGANHSLSHGASVQYSPKF
jgi:hypothetical protein